MRELDEDVFRAPLKNSALISPVLRSGSDEEDARRAAERAARASN